MKDTYKCAQQGRYYLGVTKVGLADSSIREMMCIAFDYSIKRIVGIKDFAKAIREEMTQIKKLKCEILTSPWVISNTPEGYSTTHKEDTATHLKRVGNRTFKNLATTGIIYVKNQVANNQQADAP